MIILFLIFSKAMMTCSEQKTHTNGATISRNWPLNYPWNLKRQATKIHPIFISFQASMVCLAFSSHRLWFEVTIYLKPPRENYLSKNVNWFELSCLEFEHILSEWLLYNSNFLTLTCSLKGHFHHHWLPSWKISEIRMMLVNYHVLGRGRAWCLSLENMSCFDAGHLGKPVRFLMPIWFLHGNFLVSLGKLKHGHLYNSTSDTIIPWSLRPHTSLAASYHLTCGNIGIWTPPFCAGKLASHWKFQTSKNEWNYTFVTGHSHNHSFYMSHLMTYQSVWTPDVARWSWNRNDYIHSLRPGTVWFPPDGCISREKARLQRSVLWEQQRNGEEILKIMLSLNGLLKWHPTIQTFSDPGIPQGFLKVETRWNQVQLDSPTKTMALFFKTRTTALPLVKSSISPNWNLWNLVSPNPINGSHMISPDCEVSQPFYD